MVREEASDAGVHAGILLDLQGPKIRLGTFENGGCVLETGSQFRITTEQIVGNCARASTTYKDFVKDVSPGDRVLLADGSVELRVVGKTIRSGLRGGERRKDLRSQRDQSARRAGQRGIA